MILSRRSLAGLTRIKTFGHSMEPLLFDQDVVIVKKAPFASVKTNDILCVRKKNVLFTHRVIYKSSGNNYLITQGDNNPRSDGKIFSHHVIGKIYRVSRDHRTFDMNDLYLFQSTIYFQEILKIKKAFEKEKIEFIVLKGLPLHLYLEKTHPRRFYCDCDVLINRKDFQKAEVVLLTLGYKKYDTSLFPLQKKLCDTKVELSYYKVIGGLPVIFDIHLEVVFLMTQFSHLDSIYPKNLVNTMTEAFFKEKQFIKIHNTHFPILSRPHLITYLALHFFHHNFKGVFRLELINLAIKTNHDKQLWTKISQDIKTYKLNNFVYPSFILLKKYLGTTTPRFFLKKIKPGEEKFQYMIKNIFSQNVFDEQPRITAGMVRFKNIFFLSSRPILQKLAIFFNQSVVYSIFFVCREKIAVSVKKLAALGNNLIFK